MPILIDVPAAYTYKKNFVDLLVRIMATGRGKRVPAGTRVSYFIDVDAISLEQNANTFVIFYYSRSVSFFGGGRRGSLGMQSWQFSFQEEAPPYQ